MVEATAESPRIYVACLAAYNNGKLHGRWIDATDADTIQEETQEMLKESPQPDAEEWAIHDYDGFHGVNLGESASFEDVAALAGALEEHGEAYAVYMGHVGEQYASVENFEEAYRGAWNNEEAYAEETMGEIWEIPEHLQNYIDWESVARDLFIDDVYGDRDGSGQFHVFDRNC